MSKYESRIFLSHFVLFFLLAMIYFLGAIIIFNLWSVKTNVNDFFSFFFIFFSFFEDFDIPH